jgi:hypothetical protein
MDSGDELRIRIRIRMKDCMMLNIRLRTARHTSKYNSLQLRRDSARSGIACTNTNKSSRPASIRE